MSEKLKGLEPGDRVRITSEAEVVAAGPGGLLVRHDGGPGPVTDRNGNLLGPSFVAADTFKVERLPRLPKAGQFITWAAGNTPFEVLAIRGEDIILYNASGRTAIKRLEDIADWREVPQ